MRKLVPLCKNPGLKPIGVGEMLRRIAGIETMILNENYIANQMYNMGEGAGRGGADLPHPFRKIEKRDGCELNFPFKFKFSIKFPFHFLFLTKYLSKCPNSMKPPLS